MGARGIQAGTQAWRDGGQSAWTQTSLPNEPQDPSSAPLCTQAEPPNGCPSLGATDPVKLLLVAEERVVVAVLALPVFGDEEAPPLLAAAGGADGLTGRNICSPKLVGRHIAKLLEELWGQGQGDTSVTLLLGHVWGTLLGTGCCPGGTVGCRKSMGGVGEWGVWVGRVQVYRPTAGMQHLTAPIAANSPSCPGKTHLESSTQL